MKLRKLATFATLATIVGLPAAAQATTPVSCNSLTERAGNEGQTVKQGVCVQGTGYVEVGLKLDPANPTKALQVYVVASSDANGYVGVSSFESSSSDTQPCGPSTPDGSEGGSGTNSGGCYGTNTVQVDLTALSGTVPLPVCGDNTGAWYSSSRNGCRVDNEDVNQGVARALAAATCIQANPAAIVTCVETAF